MNAAPTLALTVDLEDAHHGLRIARGASSLDADIEWILAEFCSFGVQATFYVLGEVLDSHPQLIRQIAHSGHEIGFHGAHHRFLQEEGRAAFESTLVNVVSKLEDCTGARVHGFRAPFFSVVPQTCWALDALARHGMEYDASVYPGRNDRYGWPGAPSGPVLYRDTRLVLFPVPLLHARLPIGFSGGAYLRLLPHRLVDWGLSSQQRSGRPGMIYFHPWEIAPALPWRADARLRANLTRHALRGRMRPQLRRLLEARRASMGPMHQVIAGLPSLEAWYPPQAGTEAGCDLDDRPSRARGLSR